MRTIPRHLASPPTDIPILEWWASCYDHVFAVLNPFFQVPGYHPQTAGYGPIRSSARSAEEIIETIQDSKDVANRAPERFDDLVKKDGQRVSWESVRQAVGAPPFEVFARTVWLWTVKADRKERDALIEARLEHHCHAAGIYPPEEDMLPAVLEHDLGQYLMRMGVQDVTLWSEWRDVSAPCPVSALLRDAPAVILKNEKLAAISAPGFLISWDFDDVVGLMCLSDRMRGKVDPQDYLEGFWVGPGMYSDILNPVDYLPRKGTQGPN